MDGTGYGVRPAFNLDTAKVPFISAATGGKGGTLGTLGAVPVNTTDAWKLTVLDNAAGSGRENFAVSTTSASFMPEGGNMDIVYSGAKAGTDEYLSVLLVDRSNNVLYYGRLKGIATSADASGTQSVVIPALPEGVYTLKVFNEQCNDDYKTDYSSAMKDVTLTVTIEDEPGTQLDTSGIGTNDFVYFGTYTSGTTDYDVPWRVLDASGRLFSKYLLGSSYFCDPASSTTAGFYGVSTLKSTMDGMYNGANTLFTAQEQGAIKTVASLDCADRDSNSPSVSDVHLYPLSWTEANNTAYFANNAARVAYFIYDTDNAWRWWLRSSGTIFCADRVGFLGEIPYFAEPVGNNYGVRPSFNLDMNAVLFASPAESGKSSGVVGSGALIPNLAPPNTTEWKLTLRDNAAGSGRETFAVTSWPVESVTTLGGNVSISYSGAKTGTNEYLSAMLVNSSNEVLYYGRLNQLITGEESGTQTVAIPALREGNYTLKVFNEQYNGDYKTDYASAFQDVTLTVTDGPVTPPTAVTFSSLAANGSATEATTELTLTFDKDITGLTAAGLTVDGATKGTLTKQSGTGVYKLTISAITVADNGIVTVTVNTPGYTFIPDSKTVAVRNPGAPLTFTNSSAYNVPAGTVNTAITPIDVRGGVSGGTGAYSFSFVSGAPSWLSITTAGVISGTRPLTVQSATTATVKVTDGASPANTDTITIDVGAVTAAPPAPAAPVITTQPASVSITAGQRATFTVAATGYPAPAYLWEESSDGSVWTAISGATSARYTTGAMPLAASGHQYRCVVSNSEGSVTSDIATLTVTAASTPGGGYIPPANVTVYNDPSASSATVWLTGGGLAANDMLVTDRLTSGGTYKAMLKLADGGDVFRVYDIYLKSGRKSTGYPMYLHFDLADKYAGQGFTLVHQKADGTAEYFYSNADINGDLTFGPLYELSPFMLVKGMQSLTAGGVKVPDTGDSAMTGLGLGLMMLALAALAAYVALAQRYRRKS